ncbi:MAG TPA: wax ester/triacylglycerol synthase family O-acyltransferase, partial [Beijerinckiaceae bacterium]|nr:wax ester/triacylglycerol synthase family O-acyltransferase [Beijerinckiaceae bacterium]
MPHSEKMSPVDTTWLRMDRPNNLMVIVGVLKLAGPVNVDRLEKAIVDRLLVYRRFRQRVETRPAGTWWVEDPDFDPARHIHRIRLPGEGGDPELEHFVGEQAAIPLDHAIPLWQIHIVEGFQGGAALVVRIHHAIADGIALIGVMLSLTDEMHMLSGGGKAAGREAAKEEEEDDHDDWLHQMFAPLGQALKLGGKLSNKGLKYAAEIPSNPGRALDYLREGTSILSELAGLILMSNDSQTPLKGKPHGIKRVAWSEPMPLAEVKALSRGLGCSVNDILLSSVAGAINSYIADRGETTDGVEIRALVPVNLRKEGRQIELGNRFGIVALELPVGIDNPLERVFEVRRRMDQLKKSYEAPVTFGLLSALGYAPKIAQDLLFDTLLSRATAVMTNVPGPQFPMSIAGSQISQIMFWVPQAGDVGIGVSILTYNGKVQFGLITDAALVPDPKAIIAGFRPHFERLLYHTLMEHEGADDEAPAQSYAAARRAEN